MKTDVTATPQFCAGILYFGEPWEGFSQYAESAVIREGKSAISDPHAPDAVYQTLLMADALRYLTLQTCGSIRAALPAALKPTPRW